jgi:hypothetical protein
MGKWFAIAFITCALPCPTANSGDAGVSGSHTKFTASDYQHQACVTLLGPEKKTQASLDYQIVNEFDTVEPSSTNQAWVIYQ